MTEVEEKDNIIESGVLYMKLGDNFGQFFTDFMREIAWDDCKRDTAVLKVLHALHGISTEDAEAIVDGTKRFVTMDDGIHVEMLDDDWTPPDLEAMRAEAVDYASEVIGLRSTKQIGGNWFSYLPKQDQLNLQLDAQFVILMAKENPRKALNMKRILEQVCHETMLSNSARFKEKLEQGQSYKEATKVPPDAFNLLEEETLYNIAVNPTLSNEQKGHLMRVTKGLISTFKGELVLKEDNKFEYDTGWLTPEGVYFGCLPGQHIPLAHLITDEFFYGVEGDNEQILEKEGWMKCTDKEWWTTEKPPTPAQKQVVVKWAQVHGQKIKWNRTVTTVRELQEDGEL